MSSTLSDIGQRTGAAGTPASEGTSATSRPPVTVLLVDDDRVASYSLWALLNWRPGIRVCATAENSGDARRLARRLAPDVCLVSAALGCRDGGRLTHELKQAPKRPRILIYDDRGGPRLTAMARLCSADGAFSRYGDPGELTDLIQRAAGGKLGRAAHHDRGVTSP
ncbi:MAG TPA: response regulator [Solirubrobacteraceae bacterium]|nr:response regulator [Solirubrobacteraceae bacterium]